MTQSWTAEGPALTPAGRRIPVWAYVLIVIVYLAILQGLPVLLPQPEGADAYAAFGTVDAVVRSLIIPVGPSVVFGIIVASVLGWWRPILRDDRPVQRWVWIVPIVMLVAIVAGANYALIGQRGASLFLLLLIGCLLVGVGEELMYRGTASSRSATSDSPKARWRSGPPSSSPCRTART